MRFSRRGGSFSYTTRVQHCLARAHEEAGQQDSAIGPEHVLLGLLADPSSPAMAMLQVMGIAPDRVRERLGARLPPPGSAPAQRGSEWTAAGKVVREQAMRAALELSHEYVGTEHLLLGLLAGGDPVAAATLMELGASSESARQALRSILEPPRAPTFRVTLDDTSDRSIFEQIVAQVQEAVATGRLAPGKRLATVRQLADDLDIAPGTVARAYAELERRGVVRTEGARGTRVAERPPGAAAPVDPASLVGLLRPVAVAAFHLGATAEQLRAALDESMRGILTEPTS